MMIAAAAVVVVAVVLAVQQLPSDMMSIFIINLSLPLDDATCSEALTFVVNILEFFVNVALHPLVLHVLHVAMFPLLLHFALAVIC